MRAIVDKFSMPSLVVLVNNALCTRFGGVEPDLLDIRPLRCFAEQTEVVIDKAGRSLHHGIRHRVRVPGFFVFVETVLQLDRCSRAQQGGTA